MSKASIKLTHRQLITAASESILARQIHHFTYQEYLLKSQAYNTDGRFTSFTALKAHDGRANSLHYKCGFAVSGIIESLQKKTPEWYDNTGTAILFDNWQMEVIETDVTNPLLHQIAITYTTGWLQLMDVWNNYLVLSYAGNSSFTDGIASTFLLPLQPGVSVVQYQAAKVFSQLPG